MSKYFHDTPEKVQEYLKRGKRSFRGETDQNPHDIIIQFCEEQGTVPPFHLLDNSMRKRNQNQYDTFEYIVTEIWKKANTRRPHD